MDREIQSVPPFIAPLASVPPDAEAPARFRAVQEAYEVLSDDAKRQAYDDNRRRNLLDDPAATARDIWQAYFEPLVRSAR